MAKRIAALLTAIGLVLSLCSCSDDGDTVETTQETTAAVTEATDAETTAVETTIETTTEAPTETTVAVTEETTAKKDTQVQLGPLFEQYVVKRIEDGTYTMKFKQLGVRLITTFDGKNSVIESNASGILQITLINKDGRYFMLVPTTKKYVEMSAEEYADQAESFDNISVSFDGIKLIETGEQIISGTAYQTETYDEGERGTVTYYFTEDGLERLKSVKNGETNNIEAFQILSDIDPTVFDIPDDYKLVDDPGQVMLP